MEINNKLRTLLLSIFWTHLFVSAILSVKLKLKHTLLETSPRSVEQQAKLRI